MVEERLTFIFIFEVQKRPLSSILYNFIRRELDLTRIRTQMRDTSVAKDSAARDSA